MDSERTDDNIVKEVADYKDIYYFKNLKSGQYVIAVNRWYFVILFAPIYFALKGMKFHCITSFILMILTLGLSNTIYAFFAHRLLVSHYLRNGWVEVEKQEYDKRNQTYDKFFKKQGYFNDFTDP